MSWARVTSWSVVASSSSPAVTLTVCTVPQFSVVKVNSPSLLKPVPDRVRSVPEYPVTVTVTSPAGCEVSTTV